MPHDGEDYVHRIGRTARADADGTAITFIGPKEQRKFGAIEQLLGYSVQKEPVPASFGETPSYNPSSPRRSGGGNNRGRGQQYRGKGRPKN